MACLNWTAGFKLFFSTLLVSPRDTGLEYVYRTSHPVLRWLLPKLAEWVGENLQEALGFPDKGDVRAGPGLEWTAAELNDILQAHVVDGKLTAFGCVE